MNLFKKNKKAQMHVEVVLSFALFISALLIIFFFFNPLTRTAEPININTIQKPIINQLSSNVGMISVITKTPNSCYYLSPEYTQIYGTKFTEVQTEDKRKYILYFSEFLNNEHPNNKENCGPEYNFGIYLEDDLIIYQKVQEVVSEYESDYSSLKKRLSINDDFIFKFKKKDRTEIPELSISKTPPSGIDISAKEFPVRVIKENGEVLELILNIQAW